MKDLRLSRLLSGSAAARGLPVIAAFVAVSAATVILEPSSFSYTNEELLLAYTLPLGLAALSQMVVMSTGDIDLGIGAFVGVVNALAATLLYNRPLLGALALVGSVAAYAAMGALIAWRQIPAIIVTLGASFVWAGLGLVILPTPGGTAPTWIQSIVNYNFPLVPLAIVALVVAAIVLRMILMSTRGTRMRGLGSNPAAVRSAGISALRVRLFAYSIAGIFAVLAGLVITGDITSGDSTVSSSYTLLSIAAVVLGGGDFSGGRVSPMGAVLGAATLGLLNSLLTFVNISSNYQVGLEGVLLIAVLLIRWLRSAGAARAVSRPLAEEAAELVGSEAA